MAIRLGFLSENFSYNYLFKHFIGIPIQILKFLSANAHNELGAPMIKHVAKGKISPFRRFSIPFRERLSDMRIVICSSSIILGLSGISGRFELFGRIYNSRSPSREPLSPILGLGVNPSPSKSSIRTPPRGSFTRPQFEESIETEL